MQIGRIGDHLEQQTQGINQEEPLAPEHCFAGVKASSSTLVGPHGLTVDNRCTRCRISSRPLAGQLPQVGIIHLRSLENGLRSQTLGVLDQERS
jgi:hypothetical protein